MTMDALIFYSLAVITVVCAVAVILARNPMYSVLALIACFFTIAGHYIFLNAQFMAITHIIVYAGAIMVLFLFVVMLLNLNTSTVVFKSNRLKFAAVISAGLLFLTLLAAYRSIPTGTFAFPADEGKGLVENIGRRLFTDYLIPLEISSVLFLSAMIGAVMLAKKERN